LRRCAHRCFHITPVVDRLDDALDCHALFLRPSLEGGYWDVPRRHAILTSSGASGSRRCPRRAAGGRRFAGIRRCCGSRLHSLEWYVKGIDDLADELHRRVSFYDSDGDRDHREVPRPGDPLPPRIPPRLPPLTGRPTSVTPTSVALTAMRRICSRPPTIPPPTLVYRRHDMRSDPIPSASSRLAPTTVVRCDAGPPGFFVDAFGGHRLAIKSENLALG